MTDERFTRMTYSLADIKVGDKITLEHGDGSKLVREVIEGADFGVGARVMLTPSVTAGLLRLVNTLGWSITSIEKATPAVELPEEAGSIILWQDSAYLPRIAIKDPQRESRINSMGWWAPNERGEESWILDRELLRRIAGAPFTRLAPEAETAEKVLERIAETFRDMSSDTRSRLAGIGTEFGVTS